MISIVIPNLNSPIIGKTIDSIKKQTFKGEFEVIVVGQDKYKLINEHNGVRFIDTQKPLTPGAARNIGIKESRGDIVVFIDADCIADENWLEQLYSNYQNSTISVVGGGVDFPFDNYWTLCDNIATFHEYLYYQPKAYKEQLPSINLSIRKTALLDVGLFDERPAGEDTEICLRLRKKGFQLLFDPKAKVYHHHQRRSLKSITEHAHQFGRFSLKVDRLYAKEMNSPLILKNGITTLFFSPILAAGVVIKILFHEHLPIKYWITLPMIFIVKLVWCFGATRTLLNLNPK